MQLVPHFEKPNKTKVLFATPTYDYQFSCDYLSSMMATSIYLAQHDVEVSGRFVGGICFIDLARNDLVKFFMEETDCTDLFFIDADVGWDWRVVPRFLNAPQEIVAGLVPKRRDEKQWHDNAITGNQQDGLLECLEAPTAFMRIKRSVFEKLDRAYPEYADYNTLEHGKAYFQTGWTHSDYGQAMLKTLKQIAELSSIEDIQNIAKSTYDELSNEVRRRLFEFRGEDIFFCRQWVNLGHKIYLDADINFSHRGSNAWKGNYMSAGVEMGKLTLIESSAA
jgi:hypothetical protein